MINPKILEILASEYGLYPSRISEDANLVFFQDYLTLDFGPGRRNDNNLKGCFDLYFLTFSLHGDIDFSTNTAITSNITYSPDYITINEFLNSDLSNLPNENVFNLLGLSKIQVTLK